MREALLIVGCLFQISLFVLAEQFSNLTVAETIAESVSTAKEQAFSNATSAFACADLLPGDLYFYMVQSQIPNQVGIVTFVDLPQGLELYLTDNAWNGDGFQTNEGTLKLTIPESGIAEGSPFGYGRNTFLGNAWEMIAPNFLVQHEFGDELFLYCQEEDTKPFRFLAALSTAGGFQPPGWTYYLEYQSALPEDLLYGYGAVSLQNDGMDYSYYDGPLYENNDDYQKALMDPTNWIGKLVTTSPEPAPSLEPAAIQDAAGSSGTTIRGSVAFQSIILLVVPIGCLFF